MADWTRFHGNAPQSRPPLQNLRQPAPPPLVWNQVQNVSVVGPQSALSSRLATLGLLQRPPPPPLVPVSSVSTPRWPHVSHQSFPFNQRLPNVSHRHGISQPTRLFSGQPIDPSQRSAESIHLGVRPFLNQPAVRDPRLGGSRPPSGLLGNPPVRTPRMPSMDRMPVGSQRLSGNTMGSGANYGMLLSQESRYSSGTWAGGQRGNERRYEGRARAEMSGPGRGDGSQLSSSQVNVDTRQQVGGVGRGRGRVDTDMTRRRPAVRMATSQAETDQRQGTVGNSRQRKDSSVAVTSRSGTATKQSEVIDITRQDDGRRASDVTGDDDVICIGPQTLVTPQPGSHSLSPRAVSGDGRRLSEPVRSTTAREENSQSEERRVESSAKAIRQKESDIEIVSDPGDVWRRRLSSNETVRDRDNVRKSEEREAMSMSIRQNEEMLTNRGNGGITNKQAKTKERALSLSATEKYTLIPAVSSGGEREKVCTVTRSRQPLTSPTSGVRGVKDKEVVIVPESEIEVKDGRVVDKSNVEKRSRVDDRGSASPRNGQRTLEVGRDGQVEVMQQTANVYGVERTTVGHRHVETDTPVEDRGREGQKVLSQQEKTLTSDRERMEKLPGGSGMDGNLRGKSMNVEKEERIIASDEDEHDDIEELVLKYELIQQELQKINEKEAAAISQQGRRGNQETQKPRRQSGVVRRVSEHQQPSHSQQAMGVLRKRRRRKARQRARLRVGGQERMVTIATGDQQFVRQRLEKDVAAFLEKGVLPLEGRSVERGKKSEHDSSGEDEEERLRQQLLKSMQRKGNQTESKQTTREESSSSQTSTNAAFTTEMRRRPMTFPSRPAQIVATTPKLPVKKQLASLSVSKSKVASVYKLGTMLKPKPLLAVAKKTLKAKPVEMAKGLVAGNQKGEFIIEVNGDDSDSDVDVQEVEHLQQKQLAKPSNLNFSGMSLEDKIKQLRKTSDQSVTTSTKSSAKMAASSARKALTPDSIAHLPRDKLEEYKRLRIEIINRERKRKHQEVTKPHSKRPKLAARNRPQSTSQVPSSRTRMGSRSLSVKKQVGNRMAGVTKSVAAPRASTGMNSEMKVAVLSTRLAAENSLLSGRVDKVALLRDQLKDAVNEMDSSLENVRELQVSVKRLGKADQETVDKTDVIVRRSLEVMRSLADWVRVMDNDSMETDVEASTDEGKQMKLIPEVLQRFKDRMEPMNCKSVIDRVIASTTTVNSSFVSEKQDIPVEVQNSMAKLLFLQSKRQLVVDHTHSSCKPFVHYESPLTVFRSYRLSPHFSQQQLISHTSAMFREQWDSHKTLCQFDLNGKCNDKNCKWLHLRPTSEMSEEDSLVQLLEFAPELAGAKKEDSEGERKSRAVKFVQAFCGHYSQGEPSDRDDRKSLSEMMASKVNKHLKQHHPFYVCFQTDGRGGSDESESHNPMSLLMAKGRTANRQMGGNKQLVQETSHDDRYFGNIESAADEMERLLKQDTSNFSMWIQLADMRMKQHNSVDQGLHILSRALEHNRSSELLWLQYLQLYRQRDGMTDLSRISQKATEFCPSFSIFWHCLQHVETYENKISVISNIYNFLDSCHGDDSTLWSHQMLEIILYETQVKLLTGRLQEAKKTLVDRLKGCDMSMMAVTDLCIGWIACVHVMAFDVLPARMFDPITDNPSRIANKELFVISWSQSGKWMPLYTSLVEMLHNAAEFCKSDDMSRDGWKSHVCLESNLIRLHMATDKNEAAVDVAQRLLNASPNVPDSWLCVGSMWTDMGSPIKAMQTYQEAVAGCSFSPSLYLALVHLQLQQGEKDKATDSLIGCIHACFQEMPSQALSPLLLYRRALHLPVPYNVDWPKMKASLSEEETTSLSLNYCLLVELNNESVSEAFEYVIAAVSGRAALETMWRECICWHWRKAMSQGSDGDMKAFCDCAMTCLSLFPIEHLYPRSHTDYWSDYRLHNQVVDMLLACLPLTDQLMFLEQHSWLMPNVQLMARLCAVEHEVHPMSMASSQSHLAAVLQTHPTSLRLWTIAIAIECAKGRVREARWMYKEALKSIPLSSSLWTQYLKFEVDQLDITRQPPSEEQKSCLLDIVSQAGKLGVTMELIERLLMTS